MQPIAAQNWIAGLDYSDYCWPGWARSPESVSDWIRDLAHPDDLVRAYAARALGQAGRAAEAAVPRLEQLLHDSKTGVRFAAAHSLQQIAAARGRAEEPASRVGFQSRRLGIVLGVPFLLGLLVLAGLLHTLWPYLIHP